MSDDKIKPCRCGQEARLERIGHKYQIECCGCGINTDWQFDRKKVIYAWNNRPFEDAKDTRIANLEAENKRLNEALEKAKETEWKRGYLIACCNIQNLHCETTIAEDVLHEAHISQSDVDTMDLAGYDEEALATIREFARKDPIDSALSKEGQ